MSFCSFSLYFRYRHGSGVWGLKKQPRHYQLLNFFSPLNYLSSFGSTYRLLDVLVYSQEKYYLSKNTSIHTNYMENKEKLGSKDKEV
jgi:hypothetical protein